MGLTAGRQIDLGALNTTEFIILHDADLTSEDSEVVWSYGKPQT